MADVSDVDAFLALNRESEDQLWPLTETELTSMLQFAYHAVVTADGDAMLLAFDQSAPYASPNFRWFKERYPRFAYVDRIAVTRAARGRGLARGLYEELIAKARSDGHTMVCAEFYVEPPNHASAAFHAAMGFVEVGSSVIPDRGNKRISFVMRAL